MPKVATITIRLDGAIPDELAFSYQVHVTREGFFTTTLPENIVEKFQTAGLTLKTNRLRNPDFFEASTLTDLKREIAEACQEYVSKELIHQKIVLRYAIDTWASYCLDEAGVPVPSGYYIKRDLWENEYPRYGFKNGTVTTHAASPHAYGLLVYVQAFVRQDYRYRSGREKTFYEPFLVNDTDRESQPNLHWIASLTSISRNGVHHIQEVDYEEPVAAFFVNMLTSIFNLNEKIKDFLTPDAIRTMAYSGVKILGSPAEPRFFPPDQTNEPLST